MIVLLYAMSQRPAAGRRIDGKFSTISSRLTVGGCFSANLRHTNVPIFKASSSDVKAVFSPMAGI